MYDVDIKENPCLSFASSAGLRIFLYINLHIVHRFNLCLSMGTFGNIVKIVSLFDKYT